MTPEERDRLATLEQEMRDVRDDMREIKVSLKSLEMIAQSGSGAFRTMLYLGAALGWVIGLAVTVTGLFKH